MNQVNEIALAIMYFIEVLVGALSSQYTFWGLGGAFISYMLQNPKETNKNQGVMTHIKDWSHELKQTWYTWKRLKLPIIVFLLLLFVGFVSEASRINTNQTNVIAEMQEEIERERDRADQWKSIESKNPITILEKHERIRLIVHSDSKEIEVRPIEDEWEKPILLFPASELSEYHEDEQMLDFYFMQGPAGGSPTTGRGVPVFKDNYWFGMASHGSIIPSKSLYIRELLPSKIVICLFDREEYYEVVLSSNKNTYSEPIPVSSPLLGYPDKFINSN